MADFASRRGDITCGACSRRHQTESCWHAVFDTGSVRVWRVEGGAWRVKGGAQECTIKHDMSSADHMHVRTCTACICT